MNTPRNPSLFLPNHAHTSNADNLKPEEWARAALQGCGLSVDMQAETATQPSPETGQRRDFRKKVVDWSGGHLEANGQVPQFFMQNSMITEYFQ